MSETTIVDLRSDTVTRPSAGMYQAIAEAEPMIANRLIGKNPKAAGVNVTMRLPDDRTTYSKTYAENLIAILMGGRIAEEIIFGEYNTGASDDIDRQIWDEAPTIVPLMPRVSSTISQASKSVNSWRRLSKVSL